MSHVINSRALIGEKPCIKAIHARLMHGVRETSVERQNKIVLEIMRNVTNVFRFYAIIVIEHGFTMH